jgi:serine/threonine protein phosphatase 1
MSRRLVIPDIHGCSKTFKALVEKIGLTHEDTLYLLGDYIDRGPDNCGVIDYIINLQSNNYNIKPLRGNHEQEILEAYDEYDTATFKFYVRRFRSEDLIDNQGNIKEPYFDFMKNLPYYYQLPDHYLVHGGINFDKENPFDDLRQLLVSRKSLYNAENAGNRRIVFGHQPTHIQDINMAIEKKSVLLPLDNDCIYNKPHKVFDYTRLGSLVCLDLDSYSLFVMRNIDV